MNQRIRKVAFPIVLAAVMFGVIALGFWLNAILLTLI